MNPNLRPIKYSIIILIYHRTPELVEMAKNCLNSVIQNCNREESEIILVDNGSTERWEWDKHVDTYIRFKENMGISAGWNAGLKASKGKYKVILGDDVTTVPGYLEALVEAIEQPQAGLANVHTQGMGQGVGIEETYKWFSGACFMLTQKTLNRVGYFDEGIFPCNHEDTDYTLRVYKAGLKLYKNHQLTVLHKEGQTVHAPDLSAKNGDTHKYFVDKHGFDPIPIFYGDKPLSTVL